ncbi:MAG TPA: hypothetical protein VMZ90_10140 [Vicinamibacterales bacterium]|nr:hypothetical protein [Vicinamibacterales bacterium]
MVVRPDLLELTLAAPVQLPNGRRLGASVRPAANTEPWWVYSRGNLCQSVISHGPAPTDATEGWKITVTERSRTPPQVIVGVTWSRMWERGRLVTNGSGGSSELTLQRGDRISLDTITRAAEPATCAGTMKSLELQVGAAMFNAPAPAGDSPLDGIVDAELWMVHQAPNGTETVEHQIVRLMNGVIGFTFKGGPVETTDGVVAIELSGQLKAVRRDDGSRGLWASLTRGVTRQATGLTSVLPPTTTTVGWPTTSDVVSLELPPLQLFAGSGTRAAAGGGGRGGAVGDTRIIGGSGAVAAGGQGSGGGSAAGGIARGTGGGGAMISPGGTSSLPNLLEGHRLSLRVRLVETAR